ncbi:MAG: trimeric intracellular cation channel family protein [Rickettsiales bacterium]
MEDAIQNQIMYLASTIGGVAFALSGYLIGARKNLDIMGVFILAFLTANGGGILRDLLVDRTPVILLSTQPFWLATTVTLTAWLFKIQRLETIDRRWFFVICDAIGLVAFGITGALVAIEEQVHFFSFLTLSFLTATGGGMLRDLLVGNVPEVLHSGFYGSIAIFLSFSMYFLHIEQALNPITLLAVFIFSITLRLVAYRFKWRLPKP